MDPKGSPDPAKPEAPAIGSVSQAAEPGLTSAQVIAFLRQNPGFLADHEELLPLLTPPAYRRGDNVVDMQRFLLERLREELGRVKGQQRLLISTSRSNLMSQNRIHAAVLALIGASSFEHLIQTVTSDLAVMLDIDVVTLCVEAGDQPRERHPNLVGLQLLEPGVVNQILGPKRDALLADHTSGDAEIFGAAAGLVRSQALLRLSVGGRAPEGLVALGSRRPAKFKPGQGTELLCFLARALEIVIAEWLAI
jgi:uncharacterized protein YigA (DUF484 family)